MCGGVPPFFTQKILPPELATLRFFVTKLRFWDLTLPRCPLTFLTKSHDRTKLQHCVFSLQNYVFWTYVCRSPPSHFLHKITTAWNHNIAFFRYKTTFSGFNFATVSPHFFDKKSRPHEIATLHFFVTKLRFLDLRLSWSPLSFSAQTHDHTKSQHCVFSLRNYVFGI